MNFSLGSFKLSPKITEEPAPPLKLPHTDPQAVTQLSNRLQHSLFKVSAAKQIVVVCVGTDRSTGDALGPLVGSALIKNSKVPVYGTLDEPVHAMNLSEKLQTIEKLHNQPYIIAVDACLGQLTSVGCIQAAAGPVKPGAGVNKDLPPVGDYHVTGIVNVGGFMEYFVLQNTRLHLVVNMSNVIAESLRIATEHRPRFLSAGVRD